MQLHSRRDFLSHIGTGFGGVALASLLGREGLLAGETRRPAGRPHFAPPFMKS
jgi:hypothetical protein